MTAEEIAIKILDSTGGYAGRVKRATRMIQDALDEAALNAITTTIERLGASLKE